MEFSRRKLLIDSIVYTVLPKISFLAALFILPWITPYLTLEDYGIYGLLMSYIALFQIMVVLGQSILLQNSYFTHKTKYKLVWRRSYAIMTLGGILSSIFFGIILYFTMVSKVGSNAGPIIIMVSFYLITVPLETIIVNYYILKEKSLSYAYGAGIAGLASTAITLITIRYMGMGYMGWIISLPITAIINLIYYCRRIFFIEKIIPQFVFNKRFANKALKIGIPLTPHQLSLYILGISDRLILEYFKVPIQKIGLYSQGYNIGSQGSIIVSGVFQALSKKIQEGFRGEGMEHRIFIRNLIIIVPIIISFVLFLGGLWMKEVFFLLFKNAELRQAYPVSIIVMSSYMFWSLYSFFVYPLSINSQTFSISKISIFAASFNIVGNILFIPYYNIWGSLGVTYLSYTIFGFAGLLNRDNRSFFNKYINIVKFSAFILIFNLLLFLIAFSLKNCNVLIKSVLTMAIIGCVYVLIINRFKKPSVDALPDL